jgi:cysteinyl-tRNA synthetase
LVLVDGQKMSRSLGNAPTVPGLVEQGHSGRAIRFWLLSTHYRKPLAFSQEHLQAAAKTLARLDEFAARIKHAIPGEGDPEVEQYLYDLRQTFNNFMDDDLNVAGALSVLFKCIRRLNPLLDDKKLSRENLDQVEDILAQLNQVLNIMEFEWPSLNPEIQQLLDQRDEARRQGNFSEADRLRDTLRDRGIEVIDTASGTRWQQK